MKIFYSSLDTHNFCKEGCAVTLGNFDGVHLGHRHIIKTLLQQSKKRDLPSVLYTFEPHPVRLLAPESAPPLITPLKQKLELLEQCGVDAVVVEKFTKNFFHQSALDFFNKHLINHLQARLIVVGYDYTFGAKREGSCETLERLCFERQIECQTIKAQFYKDLLVSSSLIRQFIMRGEVKECTPLLTRPFFIEGQVIQGSKRGDQIGIPTANLHYEELYPKKGIYVTQTVVDGKTYGSVTSVGSNPTFGHNRLSIETHIFKFKRKLYGQTIRLIFLERLRDQIKFSSVDQLVVQIKKDCEEAKEMLKNY
jgi:riboflavin kinase/FMN adenylyltransferase